MEVITWSEYKVRCTDKKGFTLTHYSKLFNAAHCRVNIEGLDFQLGYDDRYSTEEWNNQVNQFKKAHLENFVEINAEVAEEIKNTLSAYEAELVAVKAYLATGLSGFDYNDAINKKAHLEMMVAKYAKMVELLPTFAADEDEKIGGVMNTLNKIEIQLPFSGFYESTHDMYIDNFIEYEFEHLEYEIGYTDEQLDAIKDKFYMMDYAPIRKAICEHYINAFNAVFYDEYYIHLDLEYSQLISPQFYNFETDRLYAFIDESVYNDVAELINKQGFKAVLKEKYKQRDGFIPFKSTLDAIENDDVILFSDELLEQLLPEAQVINDYQYLDNIHEVISNAINIDYDV